MLVFQVFRFALFFLCLFSTCSYATPLLMKELELAKKHIQTYMDMKYPDAFNLTTSESCPYTLIIEFVSPFGWWKGAYYNIEFDFSETGHHNEGPKVLVKHSPPVAHLYGDELCVAQILPHSAFKDWWDDFPEYNKYGSYNFDRVQQMMNVVNFLVLDGDIFDEGVGADFLLQGASDKRSYVDKERVVEFFERISERISDLNMRASPSSFFVLEKDKKSICDKRVSVVANLDPIEVKFLKTTDHGGCRCFSCLRLIGNNDDLESVDKEENTKKCYYTQDLLGGDKVEPIVIEPDREWGEFIKSSDECSYFIPVKLRRLGVVSEFLEGEAKDLESFKETLTDKLPKLIGTKKHGVGRVYYGRREISSDEELVKKLDALKLDIARNNKHRKRQDKFACIFTREKKEEDTWNVTLKPTKTVAKASNQATQYDLELSQETPKKSKKYCNGKQWGIHANAWIPVIEQGAQEYEKIAILKLMVEFSRGMLRLPAKREAITACDGNNVVIKSLTMKMARSLQQGDSWKPSQCFLDLIVNAINMHQLITTHSADFRYKNVELLSACVAGTINRKNLKDFAFLPNYVCAGWAELSGLSAEKKNQMRARVILNSFVEYLVRVLERESKQDGSFKQRVISGEESLTISEILKRSETGFIVVAHQLTMLDFFLTRTDVFSSFEETERDQLQLRIKSLQSLMADETNRYSKLMEFLFPVAHHWTSPVVFSSDQHHQDILKAVLDEFFVRLEVDNIHADTKPLGSTFSVSSVGEHDELVSLMQDELTALRWRKNEKVESDGVIEYRHTCHFCGEGFTSHGPLHSSVREWKKKKEERGFVYRGGLPTHRECRVQRKENTQKALRLIEGIRANYPKKVVD